MRKVFLALIGAGTLSLGVIVPQAKADPTVPQGTADPAPQACRGQFISSVVQPPPDGRGPGRRTVAEMFFDDQPHAVHDAEQFLKEFICPPS